LVYDQKMNEKILAPLHKLSAG